MAFMQVLKDIPANFGKLLGGGGSSAGAGAKGSSKAQVLLPLLGLLLFTALSFYVINKVRINGEIYNEIKANDDLRADVLPPPLYAVDAFAAANEAFVAASSSDNAKRDQNLALVTSLEKQFKERVAYWRENKFKDDKSMSSSFEAVVKSNENFYNVYNKDYLPAIQLGAIAAAKPLADLAGAFEANQQSIGKLNAELQKNIADVSDSSSNLLKLLLLTLATLGALIGFLIWFFGMRQAKTIDSAVMMLENDGQANQMAVLNLLDEMGDLADGDLTVRAEVKENITGAIADSINYTIDSLRDLVTGINRASQQVSAATGQAQTTSTFLLSAAEKQTAQIAETSDAVGNMTRSILQVSSNASQASQVAQRSLQAATVGSQAVQNTIKGMNGIREQIQETSKRIKRLGESSQEIGEIVELISDITEQTNILALNAAIQAASAGEAGRGFTVVAEEVQRLAERSSEATKQIGAIVKTIQTDTNSAVAAMEKSTEGVVEGARLSDAAGKALTEIETVSNSLARLIQSISTATEAQTQVASQVTKNMEQIQQITSQTTQGTKLTAESVGQLTALSEELRDSVAGFKLS
jgi:twitching motility protein PilJ